MSKPRAILHCVANTYVGPNERIIEISNGARSVEEYKGALISLRNLQDGTFRIEVYRADPGVLVVMAPVPSPVAPI